MKLSELKSRFSTIKKEESHLWHLAVNTPRQTGRANFLVEHWTCYILSEKELQSVFTHSAFTLGLTPKFKGKSIDIEAMAAAKENENALIILHNPNKKKSTN